MDNLEFGTSIVSAAYGAYLDHAYAQNLANHLLCAFVANLKINTLYALYPESFCNKNLAIWKVIAFCDSEVGQKALQLQSDLKESSQFNVSRCSEHFPFQ